MRMTEIDMKISERVSEIRIADLTPESRGFVGGFVLKDEDDLFGVARAEIIVDSAGGLTPAEFFDGTLTLGRVSGVHRSGLVRYDLDVIPDRKDPDVSIRVGVVEVVFYLPTDPVDAEAVADFDRELAAVPEEVYEKEEI